MGEREESGTAWLETYKIVHPQKRTFLLAYASGRTIARACDVADVGRQTHYDWLNHEHDERDAYRLAFDEAKERRFEVLEQEARRRAVEGCATPIFDKEGNQIGTELEYSDVLLIFLMKGSKPEIYRDNVKHEHTGTITLEGLLTNAGDPPAAIR